MALSALSSLKVTHCSFRHASPHLWNQLPTSLRIPHPKYSSPSQRPSFEHAGLTCYTLLLPSITFSLFNSELKTYFFRKSYPPPQSISVCRTDLMAVDCSPDLFAHQCYVLVLFLCFSYSYVQQTKLASSLLNFQVHGKIESDWLISAHLGCIVHLKSYSLV